MAGASGDLGEPLLHPSGAPRGKNPELEPLFVVAGLNTAAHIVARTPAFCLQFQDLALSSGLTVATTVAILGALAALRSLVELAATPVLAQWSDRVGRKRALCLCGAAYCLEYTLLAVLRSVPGFSLVYIAGGVLASHNAIEGSCIVDATRSHQARAAAFGSLFMVLGFAFVIAPAVGGELAYQARTAPFAAAAVLAGCSLACAACWMPEYLPEARRRQDPATTGLMSTLRAFAQLLAKDARLAWYVCASAFCTLGISAFISVRTLWVYHVFHWEGREIGRVVATYGLTLVFAQFVLLPLLLWAMGGREPLLAVLCLLVHTARFTAYGLAPSGARIYTALLLSSAGACSVPVLQALCSRCVVEDDQGLLSGGASALNTAMQVIGSMIGSQVFAASMRGFSHTSAHLLVCAACCGLGAACVIPAICAEACSKRRESPPSWMSQAEGMHGMDATLPSPTARGSMLLRRAWLQRGQDDASSNSPNRRK